MDSDNLFGETDNKLIIANFKSLKKHAGWQVVEKIIQANIKILETQILEGFEGETQEQVNRKRDKLQAYKEVIETPDDWIKRLEDAVPQQDENDPYDTVKEDGQHN